MLRGVAVVALVATALVGNIGTYAIGAAEFKARRLMANLRQLDLQYD